MKFLTPTRVAALVCLLVTCASRAATPADLVGSVSSRDGKPVAGYAISLADPSGKKIGDVITDAQGHYEFHNLEPGQFTITAGKRTAVFYINKDGLTVDWGIGDGVMPIAIAFKGAAPETAGAH